VIGKTPEGSKLRKPESEERGKLKESGNLRWWTSESLGKSPASGRDLPQKKKGKKGRSRRNKKRGCNARRTTSRSIKNPVSPRTTRRAEKKEKRLVREGCPHKGQLSNRDPSGEATPAGTEGGVEILQAWHLHLENLEKYEGDRKNEDGEMWGFGGRKAENLEVDRRGNLSLPSRARGKCIYQDSPQRSSNNNLRRKENREGAEE